MTPVVSSIARQVQAARKQHGGLALIRFLTISDQRRFPDIVVLILSRPCLNAAASDHALNRPAYLARVSYRDSEGAYLLRVKGKSLGALEESTSLIKIVAIQHCSTWAHQ